MIVRALLVAVVWFGIQVFASDSQAPSKRTLTLENIYQNGLYGERGFGPVRWMKDNTSYSTLEAAQNDGQDLVRYDAITGAKTTLVSAKQLTPTGRKSPLSIADYAWSQDNTKVLIFTNTARVWRYNTRGDYWVLDKRTGKLQQVGKGLEARTLMFAKFNPSSTSVAYVSKNNIYAEDLSSGRQTQLTKDGGEHTINGTFDWVYEEELDCRDGFLWSPDGKTIAFWHSDTRNIGTFYLIDNLSNVYSKPIPLPYPKVGTKLSAVKVGVVSATGGNTKYFAIPGDATNNYLARMEFIPASSELMIQQLNRRQNTNKVWIANTQSLAIKNILTDKDTAFLDVHDNIKWLDNASAFTWTSEREGWKQLYRVSRDGKHVKLVTTGAFDVIQVSCIDAVNGFVYYIASPDNPTERYLYRNRLDGTGLPERITPPGQSGQHAYQMSANGTWAIHTFSNSTTPNQIALVELPQHKETKILEDNHRLIAKIKALGLQPKEFFRVDIGDEKLDAYIIKPSGFNPAKTYPILFYIYGEPAGATVQNNWGGGDLWHQYLAQSGYVVISVDNRGTATPRGRTWRKSIYRQVGILAAHDQAKAAAAIFKMFPFIDQKRVGMWGWSGGGQMTLNCMFRYPSIYTAGIAVSFVSDQKLYDATYQERYMGLITDNAAGYRDGSPITHAQNLKGKLMIMHGTADDNVHYQSFEMLADTLIRHNKLFSMMSYPMRSHGIDERENTTLHLRRTMEAFWKNNL